MRVIAATLLALSALSPALSQSWGSTKDDAAEEIYFDQSATFYCGCAWVPRPDSDAGSGIVNSNSCRDPGDVSRLGSIDGDITYRNALSTLDWEHVVPASLTPVGDMPCWEEGGRSYCERHVPEAQVIVFDLHNLVPSVGSVNRMRLDNRYADLGDHPREFGICQIEDSGPLFEPPDCKQGDVARIWFYMRDQHGVVIPADEEAMFEAWSQADPVSPWESERERRVAAFSGVSNSYVSDVAPDISGACSWEVRP